MRLGGTKLEFETLAVDSHIDHEEVFWVSSRRLVECSISLPVQLLQYTHWTTVFICIEIFKLS